MMGIQRSKQLGRAPRVSIAVGSDVIAQSEARNSSHCMVADAIKASIPNAKYVSVDVQTIRWTDAEKGERYVYLTPRHVQRAIILFDQGVRARPFEFRLNSGQTIESAQRRDARLAESSGSPKQQTKLLRPRKGSSDSILVRVGGSPPPLAAGNRRTFGLRALEL